MSEEDQIYLNHVIDEMIEIEGGYKPNQLFVISNAHKKVVTLEGDVSSGIIWTATQKENNNEST